MDPRRTYDYLVAARAHVFGWVRPLPDAQYRAEHPIGLGSLARTLHHMCAAEWSYMRRLRGETGPVPPSDDARTDPEVSTADAMPFDEFEGYWTELALRHRHDIEAVTDWDTPRLCETVWEGRPFRYRASAGDFLAQLAFHEVHHRAQALHMLRRLGVGTQDIDYNALMWTPVDPE